jgi:hypothetical protein
VDFFTVLQKLADWFERERVSYALIGGFALGVYGVVRGTNDLDFLIDKSFRDALKRFLQESGYDIVFESENVVQFTSEDSEFGSLDFLYAFRVPSLQMLERGQRKSFFDSAIELRVLLPEDLIGLKLQSMCNDASRAVYDYDDIKKLLQVNECDWELLGRHFTLFEKEDLYKQLRDEYA